MAFLTQLLIRHRYSLYLVGWFHIPALLSGAHWCLQWKHVHQHLHYFLDGKIKDTLLLKAVKCIGFRLMMLGSFALLLQSDESYQSPLMVSDQDWHQWHWFGPSSQWRSVRVCDCACLCTCEWINDGAARRFLVFFPAWVSPMRSCCALARPAGGFHRYCSFSP